MIGDIASAVFFVAAITFVVWLFVWNYRNPPELNEDENAREYGWRDV